MFKPSVLILVLLFICSCEGEVRDEGLVISSISGQPIEGVHIKWVGFDSTFTNEQGRFEVGAFVGCPTGCPEIEAILTKEGYKTKYVNLSEKVKNDSTVVQYYNDTAAFTLIKMEPTKEAQPNVAENRWSKVLHYYTCLLSIVNIISLAIIWRKNLQYKWIWILVICFGSVSINYNYLNSKLDVEFFRFFIQLEELHIYHQSWYILFMPVGTIVFWISWFLRKNYSQQLRLRWAGSADNEGSRK